jgi:flagellar assembly factor FliW
MQLDTTRFGTLACEARDLLLFPEGIIGFEHLHAWAVLRELPLAWLQAVEDPQVALPVVSPFRCVADYRLQLDPSDGRLLELTSSQNALVLVVIGQHDGQWTLNLRAPIIVRPELRLGRQVVSGSEHSLQHVLPRLNGSVRKCA